MQKPELFSFSVHAVAPSPPRKGFPGANLICSVSSLIFNSFAREHVSGSFCDINFSGGVNLLVIGASLSLTQKGDAVVGSRSSGARDSKIGKATIKTILVASVDAYYGVAVANIASNTDSGSFSPVLVGYTPSRSDLDRFENGVLRSVSGYGDTVIAESDVVGSNIAAAISSVLLGYVPPCSVRDSKRPSSDHGIAVFPPARSGSVFLPPLQLDLGSIVRCVTKVCRFSPIRSDLFLSVRFVDLKRVGDPVNPMPSGGGGGGDGLFSVLMICSEATMVNGC